MSPPVLFRLEELINGWLDMLLHLLMFLLQRGVLAGFQADVAVPFLSSLFLFQIVLPYRYPAEEKP